MTTTAIDDTELKARHRAMWALGDYPALAHDVIGALGQELVDACGIIAGERVLDVAAGSGNASIPAAGTGAEVVASDLTPALVEAGRATSVGLPITWRVADAEALPFSDGEFDHVISCVGVMFAPHHQAAADELIRVARPGGNIGLVNWTPEGFIGEMFATMKHFAPPPPAGVQPPPLWGSEAHVGSLFGDRVTELQLDRRTWRVDLFGSPSEFRDYFKTRYGPTISVYRSNAEDAERVAALDQALDSLAERYGAADGSMEWEYLLVRATRG
ncbi:class I SAM-dependent methyltransferase [Nocardioides sp.]|uniref:class I SAM-dependent methyltransferase n=1 Tax=Nocardioides sp. TaxID=35761 RepID=UPI0035681EDD